MKKKQITKIAVDFLMTVLLLFLMTYEHIEQGFHEWIGCGMFLMFILHHLLNGRWLMAVCKGRYTPYRIVQTHACPSDFLQYARLHVKRGIPFPDSICIPGTECGVGKRCSYTVCLLGICVDEFAPGLALEYDHGNAEKNTFEINKSG